MERIVLVVFFTIILGIAHASGQDTLPNITIKNISGQIIISWKNNYKKPVANINIQRSFDSTKNFYTIGSVLNPQNIENGYADSKPPYSKMYYRVFIAFDGGSYVITESQRPVKATSGDEIGLYYGANQWQQNQIASGITYPSRRIYTSKDNSIAINLPNAESKKFSAKFFDETGNLIFELNKFTEQYYILEKVNFTHSGWFYFKLYENGSLIEENKFFVVKDGKNQRPPNN